MCSAFDLREKSHKAYINMETWGSCGGMDLQCHSVLVRHISFSYPLNTATLAFNIPNQSFEAVVLKLWPSPTDRAQPGW
ncbi:hypothetical protein XELAEV_18047852mg [Xenopus laevis]|uniref:Uncharacterized protein n=1 Tax=Xenopus laevis TaxID=8355 RepID=A0A974BVU1_XENLA|nr:hypothetical protein XELAEV_18047852mg [Xenopus laevis]